MNSSEVNETNISTLELQIQALKKAIQNTEDAYKVICEDRTQLLLQNEDLIKENFQLKEAAQKNTSSYKIHLEKCKSIWGNGCYYGSSQSVIDLIEIALLCLGNRYSESVLLERVKEHKEKYFPHTLANVIQDRT